MTEFRVAISGPYVVAHTRTVEADNAVDAENKARTAANESGLDLLYGSVRAITVTPEREDQTMTRLPKTCAACGIATDRVVKGTPIAACGYHGGVEATK